MFARSARRCLPASVSRRKRSLRPASFSPEQPLRLSSPRQRRVSGRGSWRWTLQSMSRLTTSPSRPPIPDGKPANGSRGRTSDTGCRARAHLGPADVVCYKSSRRFPNCLSRPSGVERNAVPELGRAYTPALAVGVWAEFLKLARPAHWAYSAAALLGAAGVGPECPRLLRARATPRKHGCSH